jgi:lysozyme
MPSFIVPLNNGQFDALVSFNFNLGGGALQRSTLRRKVNREEHDDVPAELMKWVWAGGKKLRGLVRRREAEGLTYKDCLS